ncbi:acetate--CoA ligase family protein [uncultured Roseovarius sp.]|uniref:acetate--CoA ligase family protein n=1 Tax=uncultured Roseovarius sp. TaxID=293344 RepID=UPI0026310098|nr:acetate--CoA ligase family protein [uncultured Roseovarius sp.]
MTPARRQNFERLLTPRHIAFVGGADAAVAIGEARRAGFAGAMWAVNPKRTELAGIPCVACIADLPEPPDAVFLAIPAVAVPDAVAALSAMGAGGIVCYSAGFGEAHEDGRGLEHRLRAALGDMVLVGPNCYGVINYLDRAALWPFAHGGSCPGYGAAILTQSGMFSSDITMSQRSLPLTHMISVGNQADLGLPEFIDLLCEKPEVRAIGLHIEGLADIPAFERAALKALTAGKPVVALKTGSSAIGGALTLSHTGSLSGANELYQALFDRIGVISVTNPAQLLETLKFICVAGVPRGRAVMGFTCSGGGATMLADHAERIGLDFPAPDAATRDVLTGLLPPIATVSNPLDYTTPIWGQAERTAPVFEAALAGVPAQAAVLVQDYPAPGLDETEGLYRNDGMAFARAARKAGIPAAICATLPENIGAEIRAAFVAEGITPMQGIHEALNAVEQAAWWQGARDRIMASPPAPLLTVTTRDAGFMTEAEGKARLANVVPMPDGRVVPGDGLTAAAQAVGYPVALKMMSDQLAHKTEAGAVAIGIKTPEALVRASEKMCADVTAYDLRAVRDAFLIEAMAPLPIAELVVGIRQDAQFGLAMTLGSGGVLVELVGDAETLLLPAGAPEIEAALRRLRVARLMQGFRGGRVVDMTALAGRLAALAEFAVTQAAEIAEIEINPLFVYEDDVLAVDALMRI